MRRVLMLLPFLLLGCAEVTDFYKTYQDAKNDRLFERGWLPDILPETTKNIKTMNSLDLDMSHGHFTIPKEDLKKFINQLTPIADNKYIYERHAKKFRWTFIVSPRGYVKYSLKPI